MYFLAYFLNRIPLGTSAELSNLLMGLLKRNAVDRISFDDYFNHPFMNKTQLQSSQTSIEPHTFTDTFTPPKTPSPIQIKTLVATEDSNITIAEHSTHSESSSPENTNSDDFVLVPTNLPTDPTILNYERK